MIILILQFWYFYYLKNTTSYKTDVVHQATALLCWRLIFLGRLFAGRRPTALHGRLWGGLRCR